MQQAAAKHRRRGLRPSDAASSAGEVPVLLAGAALPTGGVGLVLDLTERKGAQEALEASEERFRTLARHVPGVVYLRERGGSQAFRFLSETAAIHSRPSEGTRIEVRVPLPQGREKALHGEQALHGRSSRAEEPADRRLIRKAPRSARPS